MTSGNRCMPGTMPVFLACVLILLPSAVRAESARALIGRGNAAYQQEKYDEALDAYEEAGVEIPESPHLHFNKGTVFYRKGDYEKARENFGKAALKSKDLKLEARCKFNLGNCAFRESERQRDSDLSKTLDACGKSVRYYQEALKLDPEFKEAAENIEIVRLVMKSILDEINKQKEDAEKQQQEQKQAAEKLKELIERQQELIKDNQSLTAKREKEGDSQATLESIRELADRQKNVREETDKLAQSMPAPQPNKPSPIDAVRRHLGSAVKAQKSACENLGKQNTKDAEPDQKKAEDDMKKALAAMSEPPQEQGEDQEKEKEKEERQQTDGAQKSSEKDQEQKGKEEESAVQLSEEAQDILDEEKENRNRRRLPMNGKYREVDKDW